MVPISQMTKLRHGEFQSCALGHTAGERAEPGVNLGDVLSEPPLELALLSCRGWMMRLY